MAASDTPKEKNERIWNALRVISTWSSVIFILFIIFILTVLLFRGGYTCPSADGWDAERYVHTKYPGATINQFKRTPNGYGVKITINKTISKLYLHDCGEVTRYKSFWFIEKWSTEVVDNWHIVLYNQSMRFENERW